MSESTEPATGYAVYGGPNGYHLVTAASVALEDWTSVCGRPVDPSRKAHRWDVGVHCEECEEVAGPAMRAQLAREEAEKAHWWFQHGGR